MIGTGIHLCSTMSATASPRERLRSLHRADEAAVIAMLVEASAPDARTRNSIERRAIELITAIRRNSTPGLIEAFLVEYGLSTDEGIALMCLAEALLRVPDDATIDELIDDKISPSAWGEHLGKSSSSLVNASTWALMLTGRILNDDKLPGNAVADALHSVVKRLGEPVIRVAVKRAMKEMGHQFVLGRNIAEAVQRGAAMTSQGYLYSYDMLGEAALTARDAIGFFTSYRDAILALSAYATDEHVENNPGISIKLSALHPRYELGQIERVMQELVPRVVQLALLAKNAGMGFTIDAEEADRLDLSLDVIDAVLGAPQLAGWGGFGVVVQAYSKRASAVIDWLAMQALVHDQRIMVRLVKGAYWDTEIKQAQVDGVEDYPVFTSKAATDISYLCCARRLLDHAPLLYPQFATHNAHTVAAILEIAQTGQTFEFQRLHGMGESLHDAVLKSANTRCRIYAPVGEHEDLLAYLVRRLLENGANSSFVNQIVDTSIAVEQVAADPFAQYESAGALMLKPDELFLPERRNSGGWDVHNLDDLDRYAHVRAAFKTAVWQVCPLIAGSLTSSDAEATFNPAVPSQQVGSVTLATERDVDTALAAAMDWSTCDPMMRASTLMRVAELYEEHAGELFAALCREAGKTPRDAIAELREAVDFLRYYATELRQHISRPARGLIVCISPWNFPLAIFTGQISAALAVGNGVLAKPAEPTPVIAHIAVRLMHQAGVPVEVLQLLPGAGVVIGARLTSDSRVNGVCFTGSTAVARVIHRCMAKHMEPDAPLIAETGGINAMIVDSTALPEQAVRDIVVSAFQSAGQRCSALRMLYLQEDIAENFLEMLRGAMDELVVGEPWDFATDVSPVINASTRQNITAYIEHANAAGRLLHTLAGPEQGHYVAPAAIRVDGIASIEREIFGPVLHVATFAAETINDVIDAINASGFGLTFGIHTRIDGRVEQVTDRLKVGNVYVNRNQIGAIVGSQPFGGEGLSGTGPKAGGPHYLPRLQRSDRVAHPVSAMDRSADAVAVQEALDSSRAADQWARSTIDLPGPTGESNRLSLYARGVILCLGPSPEDVQQQHRIAEENGCTSVSVAPGVGGEHGVDGLLDRALLSSLQGFDAVALWSKPADLACARQALAARDGAIIPLIASTDMAAHCLIERHVSVDTTAAGGNAALLLAQ